MISADNTDNKIVGVVHAELPGEVAHEVEIHAPVVADNSIKIINKLTGSVADATVVDILLEDEYGNRVRTAGVDPSAFRNIKETGEDVEVCRESLELRVLALDVPHVLDEDTLIRPKPVKANLGEHKTGMRLTGWKKVFPGAHIETMRGDFTSNTGYCSKEGWLIQHGQPPREGERTDLQELKVQLDSGNRPMEIANEVDGMFGVVARTERFCENYFEYKRLKVIQHDRAVPKVYIRWGPPGTGKTRWMDDIYGICGWT